MSIVVLLVLLVFATALPDYLPSFLSIDRHPPDLWCIAVLYLALRARGYKSVPWAIGIGFVRDSVSLDPLGTHAFILGTVAFVFAEGQRQRGRVAGMGRLVFVAVGVLLAGWLYPLRNIPVGEGTVGFEPFLDAVPIALWSAVAAAVLYPIFDRYKLLDDLCGRTHAFSS